MAQERRRAPRAGYSPSENREPRPPGAPPNAERLYEAAVAHLARFAATEVGLRRVLMRRVDRWKRAAEAFGMGDTAAAVAAGKQAAAEVAKRLVASGSVDDAAFAASRARRLLRGGKSRRAALAHLAAKGVDSETASAALPEEAGAELDAALAFCRRRRVGPFGPAEPAIEDRRKAMAALARGGYGRDVAERALGMEPDEAEDRLLAARQS